MAAWLAVAGLALSSSLAAAQSAESPPRAAPVAGGIIGLGVASLPEYPGSADTKIRAVPILAYHWANGVFVGGENDTVVGFQATGPSQLAYGVALGVDEGRKEYRAGPLAGMGKVATRGTLVSFAKFPVTDQLSLDSSVRLGAGNDNDGALLKVGGAYRIGLGQSAQLGFNLGATFANAAYMKSYFGVSAAQAATSSYRAYAPSGGQVGVDVGMRLFWQINRDYSLLAGVSSTRLSNEVQDSPLVRKSSMQKVFVGFARSLGAL